MKTNQKECILIKKWDSLRKKTLSETSTEFQDITLHQAYLMNNANGLQGTEVFKAPCE